MRKTNDPPSTVRFRSRQIDVACSCVRTTTCGLVARLVGPSVDLAVMWVEMWVGTAECEIA